MNLKEEQEEIKKEFQLERVILFSDAVFAIIITIMVIDIKLPENLHNANAEQLKVAFETLWPNIFAYCLSFFLVAGFWLRHLKIFSFLRDYNLPLLCLNLLFLFSVSLFPFASTLVSGSVHLETLAKGWGINIYVGIFLFSFFTQTLLSFYLFMNREKLCIASDTVDEVLQWKIIKHNIYIIPIIAIGLYAINYFNFNPIYTLFSLGILGWTRALLERYYYPDANSGPILISSFRYVSKKIRSKNKKIEDSENPDPTA